MEVMIVFVTLVISSICDIRKKEVPVKCLITLIILGGLVSLYKGTFQEGTEYLSLLPGILLMITARITGESVGYGDGFVVLFMGIYLGLTYTLEILLVALGVSFLFSLGIYTIRRNKKYEIPFVPFLLVGFIGRFFIA